MILSTTSAAVVGSWKWKLTGGVAPNQVGQLYRALAAAQRDLRQRRDTQIVAVYQVRGAQLYLDAVAAVDPDVTLPSNGSRLPAECRAVFFGDQ